MHQKLIQSAIYNLNQLRDALLQTPVEIYRSPLDILSGSTIGMHVRHILEFYQCMSIGNEMGVIDYDRRQRNLVIQNDLSYAINLILECQTLLMGVVKNREIVLLTSQSVEDEIMEIPTNTFREMTYLIEHTIHHMAIVKMAFKCHCPNVAISSEFGIAYSTLKYQQLVHSNLSAS
jgi:hypothetical protein